MAEITRIRNAKDTFAVCFVDTILGVLSAKKNLRFIFFAHDMPAANNSDIWVLFIGALWKMSIL
jgi:hypothetical protein